MDIFKTDFAPRKIESSFAIFGNPDKSLPGASSEAKNIATIYPASKLYLEDEDITLSGPPLVTTLTILEHA